MAKTLLTMPEKWHGLEDVEIRYRQRYLDLIANPEVRKVFVTRAKVIASFRRQLEARELNVRAIYRRSCVRSRAEVRRERRPVGSSESLRALASHAANRNRPRIAPFKGTAAVSEFPDRNRAI